MARGGLLALSCAVLFGLLFDLSLLHLALTEGPGAAIRAALTIPARDAVAAWGSRLCGGLALLLGLAALAHLWSSPRRGA